MRMLAALLLLAGMSDEEYQKLRTELRLKNKGWASLPWRASLTDARVAALREKKPIFMMVDTGNPIGFAWGNGIIAREAAVNDADVVETLKTRFIPYALDNVEHPNLTPAEKEFLSRFDSGAKACTIGMSAFTADGRKLAAGGGFEAGSVKSMLARALAEFKPEGVSAEVAPRDEAATAALRRAPKDGLILYVTWKLIGDLKAEGNATTGDGKYDRVFKESLGSDRLWVREDEARALASGAFPDTLKARMLRYHVRYVMSKDVRGLDVSLEKGKIEGAVPMGERKADVLGRVEAKDGKVTGFELLIKGWGRRVEDHGFSACLSVIPKDVAAPVALFFELADPRDGLAGVIPHRARDPKYLD